MTKHPTPRMARLLLVAGAVFLAGCSDPAQPSGEEALASGFRVLSEGVVLASATGPTASGFLQATAGGETPLLRVIFLDASGSDLSPGGSLTLDAEVHLTDLATLQVVSPTDFTARLRGPATGTTTARFTLRENGRPEYISPPVEIRVGS